MGIKIPTVTLSVRTAADEDARELNGNAVGLGLLVMGLLSMLYGNTACLAPRGLTALCCAFGGTVALCALLGASFDKHIHGLFRTLGPVVAGSIACTLGCAALLGAAALAGTPPDGRRRRVRRGDRGGDGVAHPVLGHLLRPHRDPRHRVQRERLHGHRHPALRPGGRAAVSYTHLTLPTTERV